MRVIPLRGILIILAVIATLVASASVLRAHEGTLQSHGELTLFLAGDTIIARPWSDRADPAILASIQAVRGADVAIVNLELVLHDSAGYGQADSGGGNLAARPAMAAELAWAGVDMVSGANNHTFDYGVDGVLDTLASVSNAGLTIAGSGPDLQRARAPAYVSPPNGKMALVATA